MPTRRVPEVRRSPLGQRAALVAMLHSLLVFPLGAFLESRRGPDAWGPEVGQHLHGLTVVGETLLVSGHDGSGSFGADGWSQSAELSGRHVLGQIDVGQGTAVAVVDGGLVRASDGPYAAVSGPWRRGEVAGLGVADGRLLVRRVDGRVLRSSDRGATWVRGARVDGPQPLGVVGTDGGASRGVIAVGAAGQLLRSIEVFSGAWTVVAGPSTEGMEPVSAVSSDPTRAGGWAVVVAGRLATTSDAGRS